MFSVPTAETITKTISTYCTTRPTSGEGLPCGENRAFYYAAMSVFDRNLGSTGKAGSEFAEEFAGFSPIDEDGFFMSYRGEEDGYIENKTPEGEALDMKDRPYNTGGVEHEPDPERRDSNTCYLGIPGC